MKEEEKYVVMRADLSSVLSSGRNWLLYNKEAAQMVADNFSGVVKTKEEALIIIKNKRIAELEKENESLKKQVEHFKTMSTVEMMCENSNVDMHIREWETRCLKAEKKVEDLKKESAKNV